MGGVSARRRGDVWEYRFEGASVAGKRRQVSMSGFRTKKEALAEGLKAYNAMNVSGTAVKPADMSLADYLEEWLAYKKPSIADYTYASYASQCSLISRDLGAVRLRALSPSQVSAWLGRLQESGLRRRTVETRLLVLRMALRDAERTFLYIPRSPAGRVRIRGRNEKEEPEIVSVERFGELIGEAPRHYRAALLLGWHCGLRISEALGLTWDRVDLAGRKLVIDRQLGMDGKTLMPPKTASSVRAVSFGERLADELADELERQAGDREEYGAFYSDSGFVCRHRDGSGCSRTAFYQWLAKRGIHFHQLRHTHATMLLEAGADALAVSKRLGHSDVTVTLGVYAHATRKMEARLDDMLDSL